jgi:hypothetical protein
MSSAKDMTGQQFGRLLVIERAANHPRRRDVMWLCENLDTKERIAVRGDTLRSGNTKGCGHLRFVPGRSKEGKRTPTAESFRNMHRRCENPNHHKFHSYGAVGVRVCERWSGENGFANFLADLGERPEGTTLGRYLDSGNYEPGNCKWMTSTEQGMEVRSKHFLDSIFKAA